MGRNMRQEPGGKNCEAYCLLVGSAWLAHSDFLYIQGHVPRDDGTIHSRLGPPTPMFSQENVLRLAYKRSDSLFSFEVLLHKYF